MKREKGFTLIELLIVVAIIGIIAAIAIPNLLTAIQRAKQKRAMGEVRSLATAVQSYATDSQIYPISSSVGSYASIVSASVNQDLTPDYIKALPNPDPWNTPYYYATATGGVDFSVASAGKDRTLVVQFATEVNAPPTNTGCFENDIVWVDDAFIQKPDGKQVKCL